MLTPLQTPRLGLVPATADLVQAELDGHDAFASLLGAAVPQSWPPGDYDESAQRYALRRLQGGGDASVGWFGWYAIRPGDDVLSDMVVAIAGFYGPPSAEGVIEIGYSVCPEWRGHGYATEAVRALTEHAFAQAGVKRILAHAYLANPASVRVLERCGYTRLGPGTAPGVIRFACSAGEREG
jgi:RimJ/RimL family protein N-acetyltransferase